jgi:Mor family transcriptional regulator
MTLPSISQDELQQLSRLLPDATHELIRVLGFAATARLIARFGGVTLYLHNGRDSLSERSIYRMLCDALSEEDVSLLFRTLGGAPLYIPRCEQALRTLRNTRFLAELADHCQGGASIREAMAELCPRYGFSDRIAWKLLARHQAGSVVQHQGSLFDN